MEVPSPNRPDLLLLKLIHAKNMRLLSELEGIDPDARTGRLVGCLLGLAVGDALGCPVEGMNFQQIRKRYPPGIQGWIYPEYGPHWRLPGLHSDDTQQALALLVAIRRVERTAPDKTRAAFAWQVAKETADIYVEGLQTQEALPFGCWRGTGSGFRNVVTRLSHSQNTGSYPFGTWEPSAGLGAVMRIPPVGVLFAEPETIVQVVSSTTRLTHTDPLATVAAYGAAYACHLLRSETAGSLRPAEFLGNLSLELYSFEKTLGLSSDKNSPAASARTGSGTNVVSHLIEGLASLIAGEPASAMQKISRLAAGLTGKMMHPTAGYAPSGLAASLYFFLHDLEQPEQALLTSLNAGGDTDTIGAITGALCGSLHGPFCFRSFLPGLVGLDLILATGLYPACPERADSFNFIEEERLLTQVEAGLKNALHNR